MSPWLTDLYLDLQNLKCSPIIEINSSLVVLIIPGNYSNINLETSVAMMSWTSLLFISESITLKVTILNPKNDRKKLKSMHNANSY